MPCVSWGLAVLLMWWRLLDCPLVALPGCTRHRLGCVRGGIGRLRHLLFFVPFLFAGPRSTQHCVVDWRAVWGCGRCQRIRRRVNDDFWRRLVHGEFMCRVSCRVKEKLLCAKVR